MVIVSSKSIACIQPKDRMSDLPDAIIIHILTFVDAKTAVRTGILSKRFAYLWTEAPCLNFEQLTSDLIYTTICFHKRLNLEKVSAIISYKDESDWYHEDDFCRFIRLLSLASVKELVLELNRCYHILPRFFYSNPCLEKLKLTRCLIRTNGFVNWKSLQSLSLDSTIQSDDKINDILSGCPSLEFLELSRLCCLSLSRIPEIYRINLTNNKCLRKLVLDGYNGSGRDTLEIVAPNLQSLALLGGVKWFCCKVLNAKSLTDCRLDFYDNNDEPNEGNAIIMLTSLLDDLSHVEVVTIGEWVVQVLSLVEQYKSPCPMSKAVKCLKIDTDLTNDDMTGIACLLRNLNRLEKLWIEFYAYDQEYFVPWFSGEDWEKNKSIWTSKNVQTKVDLKLKNVKVCYLVADEQFRYDNNDLNEVLLLKFLLENAKVMENLTISAYGCGCEHSLQEFTRTLLEFPRSSHRAVIKIEDWWRFC